MKTGHQFKKIVPGVVSWPLDPTGKIFLTRRKKNVGPPSSKAKLKSNGDKASPGFRPF
jgi:hypothetical protein